MVVGSPAQEAGMKTGKLVSRDRWAKEEELVQKAIIEENLKIMLSQTECSMAAAFGRGLCHGSGCPHFLHSHQ